MKDELSIVIPVRKGSTRVKGKNLREFFVTNSGYSHSLLSWKISQLLEFVPPEAILVSTDWDDAADVAKEFGCRTHKRSVRLAASDAPFDEVIKEVVSQLGSKHVMWAPVTSPFIGARTISKFYRQYQALDQASQLNGLIAVHELRSYALFAGRPLNFRTGQGHLQTQDITPVEIFDWGVSVRPRMAVLESGYMFSNTPETFEISPLENFDINYEIEFKMAQQLLPLFLSDDSSAG